jgi:hypothetical protein
MAELTIITDLLLPVYLRDSNDRHVVAAGIAASAPQPR